MYVLYFDICAAIVIITLIFSVISRKMTSGISNKIFMLLLIITFTADAFDLWSVALDTCATAENHSSWAVMCLSFTGYLFFHNLTPAVYFLYVVSLSDTWHKLKNHKPLVAMAAIPTIVIVIALIINVYTQNIFYFNANYNYVRGEYMYVMYLCAFTNMILCTVYLIRVGKLFSKDKLIALIAMFFWETTAVIIQLFYPELLVEMFANAIALFLIATVAQRPEELLDSVTLLGKYDAYAVDMKKNIANHKKVTLIMVNVSNFRSIQNILDFDGSNEVLQRIAQGLRAINREMKAHAGIYYLDNGRFCYIINETQRSLMENLAKKVNNFMKQMISVRGLELNLAAHICVVNCPEEINDFKTLIQFGRNFHKEFVYSGQVMQVSEMSEQSSLTLTGELDMIIDNAISNNNFKVYYQPIYSIEENKFVSAEALLRLIDDKYGFISPEIFIPAAEKSGAIHKIGDYVMEEVCRFIAGEDFTGSGLQYIEVNLSVAQCMQPDLADKTLEIMKKHGVSSDKINLEITETAADYNQNIMLENIEKLHRNGISFSLDDYGTGYSNVERIMTLPLSIVKLDKSFVNIERDSRMWTILQDTIKMLKDIDMHIVVEGIETKENLQRFAELKCDYIQGYYFSKPVPEKEFVSYVFKHNITE